MSWLGWFRAQSSTSVQIRDLGVRNVLYGGSVQEKKKDEGD